MRIWFVAAAALVAGIVIGFAAGYKTAQRSEFAVESTAVEPPVTPTPAEPTRVETPAEKTFSEAAVSPPATAEIKPSASSPPPAAPAAAAKPRPRTEPPARASRPSVDAARGARAREEAARERPSRETAPADPNAPGSIQVLSRPPGAQVFVDGRVVGRTPIVLSDVRSGAHDVRLELAGFRRWVAAIDVTAGNQTRVAASLEQ